MCIRQHHEHKELTTDDIGMESWDVKATGVPLQKATAATAGPTVPSNTTSATNFGTSSVASVATESGGDDSGSTPVPTPAGDSKEVIPTVTVTASTSCVEVEVEKSEEKAGGEKQEDQKAAVSEDAIQPKPKNSKCSIM